MDGLFISKVFFPEPGRSPLPEREDIREYDRRNRLITMETGRSMEEWQRDLEGKNVLEHPAGPAGWTAWSIILANGEVMIAMFKTHGPLQCELSKILADLNHFFANKILFTVEQAYYQMQSFIGSHMMEMQDL